MWALDWQLAPPMQPRWDETARPYLEAFLGRQIPRRWTTERSPTPLPSAESWQTLPIRLVMLWVLMLWLGSLTSYEIFVNY